MPPVLENANWTLIGSTRLANGIVTESVIEYSCLEGYHFSDEFANGTYVCESGAKWVTKTKLFCIKGIQK